MRGLLDHLVWTQLLESPCQQDHSRCPERARQCAACPHRRRGFLRNRWATIRSSWRRRRLLHALNQHHPVLAVLFGFLCGGLAALAFLGLLQLALAFGLVR